MVPDSRRHVCQVKPHGQRIFTLAPEPPWPGARDCRAILALPTAGGPGCCCTSWDAGPDADRTPIRASSTCGAEQRWREPDSSAPARIDQHTCVMPRERGRHLIDRLPGIGWCWLCLLAPSSVTSVDRATLFWCCDSGLVSPPISFSTEWSRSDPDLGRTKWG
jgi:hypothetical protein